MPILILEKQYKVYEKSVEFIKGLYTQDKDLFNNSTYKLNYKDKANSFAVLKLKMNAESADDTKLVGADRYNPRCPNYPLQLDKCIVYVQCSMDSDIG